MSFGRSEVLLETDLVQHIGVLTGKRIPEESELLLRTPK
jgi:hypothetical protein